MELDAISQPELEQIDRMGGVDILVGILDPQHQADAGAAVEMAREAFGRLPSPARGVVLCNNGAGSRAPATFQAGDGSEAPSVLYFSLGAPSPEGTPPQSLSVAYKTVFGMGGKLGARACGVIASQPRAMTSQWIFQLVQPVLELGFDLVAPCYTRRKLEGLLNRSILSPLHRALYRERLQNPLGPDFGLSGRLLQGILGQDSGSRRENGSHPVASIASTAACGGFQICESDLGERVQPPTDWMSLSSLLAQVLGPVFLDMERQAASWQRIRESRPVPLFGDPEPVSEVTGAVDTHGMIESFQLGTRNLQDVWSLVLSPTTLLELRKLSRLSPDRFRMPDDVWATIVYDFALGHRLRTISRDHLLRSLTPLYLGWIASYALEMETAGPGEIGARIERLSRAYEARKAYLVSRWRWPDRFNP